MYQNYFPYYTQPAQDMLNAYKQPYQQPIQQQPMQQQPTNEIIWVQGEAGAKGYLVAPNSTVVLWDTESPTIYVKTADTTGIPSMRVLDFTERNAPQPHRTAQEHVCECSSKLFTPIDDYKALEIRVAALEGKLNDKPKARARKDVEE